MGGGSGAKGEGVEKSTERKKKLNLKLLFNLWKSGKVRVRWRNVVSKVERAGGGKR